MPPPIPKGKWSWRFDRCINCGTTCVKGKHRHKGRGLCLSCWEKERNNSAKRRETKRKAQNKYYNKVKGTEEYKKYRREITKLWQQSSPRYKAFLHKQYLRLKYKRIINNWKNGTGRDLKRIKGGLQFRCDGCSKNCLITSPIKPDKQTGVETEKAMRELKIFKQVYIKLCDNKINVRHQYSQPTHRIRKI